MKRSDSHAAMSVLVLATDMATLMTDVKLARCRDKVWNRHMESTLVTYIDGFHAAGMVLRHHPNFYITSFLARRLVFALTEFPIFYRASCLDFFILCFPCSYQKRGEAQFSIIIANFLSACASRLAKMTFQPFSVSSPV